MSCLLPQWKKIATCSQATARPRNAIEQLHPWMRFGDAKNVIGGLVKQFAAGSGMH